MIKETKIKEKLDKFLNRKATKDEIINGYKDQNIINEIMEEEIETLQEEVNLLKEQNIIKLKEK